MSHPTHSSHLAAGSPLVIGLTGHRDLIAADMPAIRNAARRFLSDLRARAPHSQLIVVSQLAEGADTLVTEEALALGLSIACVLPMAADSYRATLTTAGAQQTFGRLLAQCNPLRQPEPCEPGLEFAVASARIAQSCSVLLALWDGEDGDGTGGTGDCVEYRLSGQMSRLQIPHWLGRPPLAGAPEDALVYHLPVARMKSTPDTRQRVAVRTPHYIVDGKASAAPPAEFLDAIAYLDQYNLEIGQLQIRPAPELTAGSLSGRNPPACLLRHEQLLVDTDHLASLCQRKLQGSRLATHALAFIAGIGFLVYSKYHLQWACYVLLVALLAIVGVRRLRGRQDWLRRHLDYRALAEGLRVQLYLSAAGAARPRTSPGGALRFLQNQDADLQWVRQVLRNAEADLAEMTPQGIQGGVQFAMKAWIGDSAGSVPTSAQLPYFARSSRLSQRRELRANRWMQIGEWVTAALVLLLVLIETGELTMPVAPAVVVIAVLAVLLGVVDSYSDQAAYREVARQHRYMARVFERAQATLERARNDEERRAVLTELGRLALAEQAAWVVLHRERRQDHPAPL